MGTPEEGAQLRRLLQVWMELSCVSPEVEVWDAGAEPVLTEPAILFWDLDSGHPVPALSWDLNLRECALFLCSADPRKAIDSYALHPTGFLTKPVGLEALERGLDRCVELWWPDLGRVEVLCERVRLKLPLCQLLWVESGRRGCVLHSSMETMTVREPLSELEQRIPSGVFARCQRSFLVNLNHVARVESRRLYLSDGTEIPLGRGSKEHFLEQWKRFCALRKGTPEWEGRDG